MLFGTPEETDVRCGLTTTKGGSEGRTDRYCYNNSSGRHCGTNGRGRITYRGRGEIDGVAHGVQEKEKEDELKGQGNDSQSDRRRGVFENRQNLIVHSRSLVRRLSPVYRYGALSLPVNQ
jgi:hypothetical protein